jgi:thiol-disulfide isomerase/thioredoxin
MNRRNWILGGAGVAAGAAGVAWQARRGTAPATPAAPLDEATEAFWQSSFAQPDGQTLVLSALRGRPLVLNFWATWCPPCVKEMPALDRFAQAFAGRQGQVVGLAVDNPTAVKAYLQKAPVSYAIGMAGFDGTELSRKLGNASGSLPFTAVFARHGAIVQRKLGETNFEQLQGWVQAL